ncbi:MAG: helix-turn-helix domain-containing protein [Verrucomicrobiota bacterium]
MPNEWLKRISPCIRPVRPGESMPSYTAHGEVPSNWTEPLRVIYDHELVLFSKGRFVVEIENKPYACPTGTFIIVPPGKRHASWETAGQPGHRYWSHFDWIYQDSRDDPLVMTFHPATPRLNACHRSPLFVPRKIIHGRIPSPPRAYELAERLCALQVRANEHDRIISRALLLELLLELLDTRTRETKDAGHDTNLAQRVRDLLEQNLDQHSNLRIPDLMERHLRYSYAHLCRVFRAKYGIPPLKYLNAVCISRAKLLLRDTDLPIAVMAQRLGFRDPLYFSQLFRKISGLSPSQYRLQTQT